MTYFQIEKKSMRFINDLKKMKCSSTNVSADDVDDLVQIKVRVCLLGVAEAGTDHRVLAHEDGGHAAELDAHILHLTGTWQRKRIQIGPQRFSS